MIGNKFLFLSLFCFIGNILIAQKGLPIIGAKQKVTLYDSLGVELSTTEEVVKILCPGYDSYNNRYYPTYILKHIIVIQNKTDKQLFTTNNSPFILVMGLQKDDFKNCETRGGISTPSLKINLCHEPFCSDTVIKYSTVYLYGCPSLKKVPEIYFR